MRRALALATTFLFLIASAASAHEGNPNYRSVVTTITPATQGVQVSVVNFDDSLSLHNTSGKDVTIFDYADPPKPYAKVLADGTVQVNTNSEAYYLNEDRFGESDVPQSLPSEPQWKTLSKTSRFEWHDHRAHWMGKGDPPNLKDEDVRTKIDDWKVPVEIGGQTGTIAGTLTWVPSEGSSLPLAAILAFAALIIGLSITVFVVRRRRAQEPVEAW